MVEVTDTSPAGAAHGDEAAAGEAGAEEEPEGTDLPNLQLVFFIRHAESRWNRAQADYSLVNMLWENDHGLSEDGRRQAEGLRRRVAAARRAATEAPAGAGSLPKPPAEPAEAAYHRHLLEPDVVYSSPFTRAICTACIGLRDLLGGGRGRLVLLPEAREQKNFGAADSTGVATGEDIPHRIEAELRELYQAEGEAARDAALEDLRGVPLDVSCVQDEWWGSLAGDAEEDVHGRVAALLRRLRRTRGALPGGGGVAIVVGHSLFLRTVFQTFLGRTPPEACPAAVAASLREQLLPFCGVVGARLEWDQAGAARIAEARPLLETRLRAEVPIPSSEAMLAKGGGQLALLGGCVCRGKGPAECALM